MDRGLVMALQDNCLINIEDGKKPDQKKLRQLPPWRALMIARIAWRAGVMDREEVDALEEETRVVGGGGKLSVPE